MDYGGEVSSIINTTYRYNNSNFNFIQNLYINTIINKHKFLYRIPKK